MEQRRKSKSEVFLENRNDIPTVSNRMHKSVSNYRKEKLAQEVDQGLFRDGSTNSQSAYLKNFQTTSAGNVVASSKSVKLGQAFGSGSPSVGYTGNGGTVKQNPEVYSPLWLSSNLNLPKDPVTINNWCRTYFALNPFVQSAISLHSTYPISKLNIKCSNKDVEKFFNDMIEEIDLMNVCIQIAQEYWLLGEAFVYADFDPNKGKWSRLVVQNPDHMIVERSVIANEPRIYMKPDANLERIVFSNNHSDIEQRKKLPDHVIEAVRRRKNVELNPLNVSHIARKISPYQIRGTGLPVSVFRQLMLFDKLKESKYAQADNMVNPMTVIKIGKDDYKPTPADLEYWRDVFSQAQYDKDFKVFTHDGVAIEKIGSGAGIYDISGDITQIIKEIFIGLQVPSVLMDGGSDTTYANGGVALDVLRQRYMAFRNMLSSWLKRKIFAPISQVQEFWDYSGGEKQLIVPDVDWNHMNLFDAGDYISTLVTLTDNQGDDSKSRRASLDSLYRSLGLDYIDETRKIRREAIQSAIAKKEAEALAAMDLNTLRALDEEDEIPEISESDKAESEGGEGEVGSPLPGEAPGGLPTPPVT